MVTFKVHIFHFIEKVKFSVKPEINMFFRRFTIVPNCSLSVIVIVDKQLLDNISLVKCKC